MRVIREHLAQAEKLYYKHQKERWFLDAVDIYGDAVNRLVQRPVCGKIHARADFWPSENI